MYGIFMENWVIFKLYGGSGFLTALYLIALVFLLVKEREKPARILFVYLPLFVLFLFFFPLFRKVYVRLMDGGETQYRILWILPMGMTIARAGCLAATLLPMRGKHLKGKILLDRLLIPAIVAAAIALCGSFVYCNPLVSRAENLYHIPQAAINVADAIAPAEGHVRAAVPTDLVHFIRQYNTDIVLAYGRDTVAYGYYNDIYERMDRAEVIDMAGLADALREADVQYLVLREEKAVDRDPAEVGLILIREVDGYRIYEMSEPDLYGDELLSGSAAADSDIRGGG
ncbi:MAG: hypothetical protein IK096_03380, partial [Lachnospiraceae bacterium]|nr:hypothetical protein [Lachnospiraceae bacterium]